MPESTHYELTDLSHVFLEPSNPTHRQYEALRAFFVEHLRSAEAAARFGYTSGSFRVLCHTFRRDPKRQFFVTPGAGPRPSSKKARTREQIVALRKQNLSVYDISRALGVGDNALSPVAVAQILKEEGFARLPRRADDERPSVPRPEAAAVADVRQFDLTARRLRTQFGGLFLFIPFLAQMPLDRIVTQAGLPGSKMVPAVCALRALLALKLWGSARHSHVMGYVFDEGLALFAGLNAIPKRAFLTEYSCRVDARCYPRWMRSWFNAVGQLGLPRGVSFDLDFHTIPFHGEDALLQKHYLTKRSRRQKGVLAFLAQDAEQRVFCYANAQVRKEQQADEILRFVEFWKQRTGKLPEELVFDSKLTTYANLNRLAQMEISFITLRRRSAKMLAQIAAEPRSAWRRVELQGVSRAFKTPRVLDRKIELPGYDGLIRELVAADLGHDEPTVLLTNQMRLGPATLIERYAKRMLIENGIADGVDFFHMDALSSAVAMKVDCDLQLTLMASSLYRLLGSRVGNGYASAKSRHIFRDLVEAAAHVTIDDAAVTVRFGKRAHNPLLLAASFADTHVAVPWWGGRRLKLVFG